MIAFDRLSWVRRIRFCAAALVVAVAGCAGGAGQSGVLVPSGTGTTGGLTGAGNTVVKIYVPAGTQAGVSNPRLPLLTPPPMPASGVGAPGAPQAGAAVPVSTPPPAPGSQMLAISVSGPTTINQTISVGPNSSGCTPAPGGSGCQLALSLPAGTYVGTVNNTAVAFTVVAATNNVLNLTLGGVPDTVAVVPASPASAQNAQNGIDLYGAGRHALLVETLDANNNVMVGGGGGTFSLSQAGGALALTVAQVPSMAPNFFYVTSSAALNGSAAILRATANYAGPANPCVQSGAVCAGTVRVDVRQILAVANSGTNSVTLYVTGQTAPFATIQNGVTSPQALVFDGSGNLFVANQTGTVTEYSAPYNQSPATISNGINHPQSLAVDARGDLFVANGNGSNTVTVFSAPYGAPAQTISANVDDPVCLALDGSGDLFVVNAAANTVTEYAPPYSGTPNVIAKGLNTPSSAALDVHGNLFVANLNSTPNSVIEYAPPFSSSSTPVATITNGVNEQGSIAAMSSNLFVPNQGANTVTEYSAPYTNPPTTIVGGQSQPLALAIDAAGNLYVANYGNNTVTAYAAPYAPGSWTTISTGVNSPLALALSPATSNAPTLLP
ncbi:MAG: hypothetical protein JO113_08500 [Candidatus Eremiobacteraeota bacterium]|nr:hypothetical protein [Candidatus Eremiobacteraeota bacterium]